MKLSITDKPIHSKTEDLLRIEKYADTLCDFITKSDTPITIGLQGEWGTGKTSLMNIIKEKVELTDTATSWVNTWEYSLFRGAKETTPAVLQGLLAKLKESCGDKWTLNDETKSKWNSVLKFAGALGNQIVASQTGVDLKGAVDATGSDTTKTISEIAELKQGIETLINNLIDDPRNKFKRVVFFVDDLDRINPTDAVEVLESLKNIFDIPNCVFVLAIDYEVVVKGLEGKFGPKTDQNEREFRSFFDKIIQVPFSMPIGTYDIDNFLEHKFTDLNIEYDAKNKSNFTKIVRYTTGYNPRSLKRYLNSFSLLNNIRKVEEKIDAENKADELMLFALLGIQISYPAIFRQLTLDPDYVEWDSKSAHKAGLDWEDLKKAVEVFGANELVDEDWEQIIWGLCQKDNYMKARAFNVLEMLNLLRTIYKEELTSEIENAMAFASLTSVDEDQGAREAVVKSGNKVRFTGIDFKYEECKRRWHPGTHETWLEMAKCLEANTAKFRKINFAPRLVSVYAGGKLFMCIPDPSKTKNNVGFSFNTSRMPSEVATVIVSKLAAINVQLDPEKEWSEIKNFTGYENAKLLEIFKIIMSCF